jgi:GTP cyclohydrolase I
MKKVTISTTALKVKRNGCNPADMGSRIASKNHLKNGTCNSEPVEPVSASILVQKLEPLVRQVLTELGQDLTSEDMKETPLRHAKAMVELCLPAPFKFTVFDNKMGYKEMIFVENIPYYSLCPHHLLQINGTAVVAYIPADEYAGLSKIPRTVTYCSSGMMTQEQITMDIANFIHKKLNPKGVAVYLNGTHACMSCRGTRMPGVNTRTFSYLGVFDTDFNRRLEFLLENYDPSRSAGDYLTKSITSSGLNFDFRTSSKKV